MRHLPDGQPQAVDLDAGEAYQRCIHELTQRQPDYQAAQVYATLSLEEAVRDATAQLEELRKALARELGRLR
jgi:hypothetical protein